jgi:hypothetical protein
LFPKNDDALYGGYVVIDFASGNGGFARDLLREFPPLRAGHLAIFAPKIPYVERRFFGNLPSAGAFT